MSSPITSSANTKRATKRADTKPHCNVCNDFALHKPRSGRPKKITPPVDAIPNPLAAAVDINPSAQPTLSQMEPNNQEAYQAFMQTYMEARRAAAPTPTPDVQKKSKKASKQKAVTTDIQPLKRYSSIVSLDGLELLPAEEARFQVSDKPANTMSDEEFHSLMYSKLDGSLHVDGFPEHWDSPKYNPISPTLTFTDDPSFNIPPIKLPAPRHTTGGLTVPAASYDHTGIYRTENSGDAMMTADPLQLEKTPLPPKAKKRKATVKNVQFENGEDVRVFTSKPDETTVAPKAKRAKKEKKPSKKSIKQSAEYEAMMRAAMIHAKELARQYVYVSASKDSDEDSDSDSE